MKKVYSLYRLVDKNIHVPSTDYYARNNQSDTESIITLCFMKSFNQEKEAEDYLSEFFNSMSQVKSEYIILPSYTKK